jgi:hypothetical protein
MHCKQLVSSNSKNVVQYFISSLKLLYMFRIKQSPIIRSSIKLYLQHLVLIDRVWPAVVVDESAPHPIMSQ